MPAERLPMRKVREVLRLRYARGERAGDRRHAWDRPHDGRRVSAARGGDRHHLAGPGGTRRCRAGAAAVHATAFDKTPARPLPDWAHVHAELKRRGVTLALLWQEYRAEHPDGYGYSRFCDLYGDWRKGITATMRQTHVPARSCSSTLPATPCRCSMR